MRIFDELPLWANVLVFIAGAIIVWRGGTRLSRAAEAISDRTGLGQAFVGALLLGGATSLPEIATTVSASLIRNAPIAVNNVFGGIAMQVAILVIADIASGPSALTHRIRSSSALFQAALLVLVLTVAATGLAVGDTAFYGVGLWSTTVLLLVIGGMFLIKQDEARPRWQPAAEEEPEYRDEREQSAADKRERLRSISMRSVVLQMTIASVAVLVGGFAVAKAGEGIAEQTGLGASFVGAILIAIATSLPEVSTTLEAVRLGARVMAVSNIFGTNLFDAALLFVADVFYDGPPVLNEVGRFAQVGALLGVACTTIYIAGILLRRQRTFMRMGLDSILVLFVYLGGVVLLYLIR